MCGVINSLQATTQGTRSPHLSNKVSPTPVHHGQFGQAGELPRRDDTGYRKEAWEAWWWEASLEGCLREAATWSGSTMGQLVEGGGCGGGLDGGGWKAVGVPVPIHTIMGSEACSVCWIPCPPAQTTLLRAVEGEGLRSPIWCLTEAGHPAGEVKDPGTDSPPRWGAFGIQASG